MDRKLVGQPLNSHAFPMYSIEQRKFAKIQTQLHARFKAKLLALLQKLIDSFTVSCPVATNHDGTMQLFEARGAICAHLYQSAGRGD
jgi:hypothetical protein